MFTPEIYLRKIKEHRIIALVIVIMLFLQCTVLIYWQTQRGNFFIDEILSIERAKAYTEQADYSLIGSSTWKYEQWMDSDDLLSLVATEPEDSLLSVPPWKSIPLLLTGRTYNGFLNMVFSTTTPFEGYAIGALILNMFLFLMIELLLAYCVRKMTGSNGIMVLSMIMFGFCASMIGMCEYLRFYIMTILLIMIVITCHLKLHKEEDIRYFLLWEIVAFICAYIGLFHSELMLVICGSLFCFFFFSLLIRRKWRNAIAYAVPLVFGFLYEVNRNTDLLMVVLHPSEYAQAGGYGKAMVTYNLLTITSRRTSRCLREVKHYVFDKWFGNMWVLIAFGVLFVIFMIVLIYRIKKGKGKKPRAGRGYAGFAVVLLLTGLTSMTFNVLTDLREDRYYSLTIIIGILLFWYLFGELHRRVPDQSLMACLLIVTIAGGVYCQHTDNYSKYLMTEELPIKTAIEECGPIDTVFIERNYEETFRQTTESTKFRDCLCHIDAGTRVYVTDPFQKRLDEDTVLPDRFLAWCVSDRAEKKMHQMLDKEGYKIKPLGVTYKNRVFLCKK